MTIYISSRISQEDFAAAADICREHGIRVRRMTEKMEAEYSYYSPVYQRHSTNSGVPASMFSCLKALRAVHSLNV